MRSLAREFQLGGVTLFKRNIEAPEQVAELSRDFNRCPLSCPSGLPSTRRGGGSPACTAPFTEWPPMATLGRSGDDTLAYRFAAALAAELKAVGITLDYAPVLDIHTNPKNPIIGDRALGEDADTVARLGAAVIRVSRRTALPRAASIFRARRHFGRFAPGAASGRAPPDRIRRVECVPFREAIRSNVAFMMTAHILVPALDEQKPATLSSTIVQDMLRGELGFEGVILSDDLEMKALADTYTVPDAAVRRLPQVATGSSCAGIFRRSALRMPRCRRRCSRRWCTPSKMAAFRTSAPKTRSRAIERRRSDSSPRRSRPAAPPRCERCWATIPTGASPTKWRVISRVIKPAAVKPGSRVAVVSPASPFSREEFDEWCQRDSAAWGTSRHMTMMCSPARDVLSGTPALRAAAFSRAWADPSVAALIAVRGGYGSVQMLPLLDEEVIRRTPKLFIGYSDNTSLLSWLTCRCGITALHGPMIEGRLAKGPEGFDADSMLAFMQDGEDGC